MSNIIQDLTSLVSSQVLSKAANQLGESESGISSVIGSLAPTILAGLLNKSNDSSAFGDIFNSLSNKNNASFLDDLGGLIGGGNLAQNDPKDIAGGLMGSLFGNKVGGILDIVTSLAGVKKSSSSSLLGMVAPMIMGYLGKKIMNGGLNASGLASLLSGQKDNITAALPSGMGDLIGFATGNTSGGGSSNASSTGASSTGGGNGFMKYLIPLLLLAGAFFAWKSCGSDVKNAADSAMDTVENVADAAGDVVGDAATTVADAAGDVVDAAGDAIAGLGDFFKRKLANGLELEIPEFGIESKVLDFIEGESAIDKETWFNFDRLTFNTNSAELNMEKSKEQLNNIAQVMTAYPNVNIKLGGYTDNTGSVDGNMKLSQSRADNVMAALVAMGIDASRMTAEGYGSEHPVATNDTAEGRAQNRRIALRVTAK